MELKEWTGVIRGGDDIELGIARGSSLAYHCTAPATKRAAGLVFIISDFGEDGEGEYQQNLRGYLAKKYGLLAVTVEYHCFQSRLNTGAVFKLNQAEFDSVRSLCNMHKIQISSPEEIQQALHRINIPYEFDLNIAPRNGDYQNFGVMQALDHLQALKDIRADSSVNFDESNIIAFGSSHGGYIAHLLAKFAPNTIRAVIDNSSYTDDAFFNMAPPYVYFGRVKVNLHLSTRWVSDNKLSPYYFSAARHAIRNTASRSHIVSMREVSRRRCQYRMVHSTQDATLAPIVKKRQQVQELAQAGFDVVLKEISAADVDGNKFKSVEHGMDASLRALFDDFYPTLRPSMPLAEFRSDSDFGSSIAYLCDDKIYSFEHGSYGCALNIVPTTSDTKRTPLRFY